MWRINESEEAIGEEVVEADHPGNWMELQETIMSKSNKVEFISNCFLLFIKQYILNIIVKKFLDVDALSDWMNAE